MEESLALFRVILDSDYFVNASIILFLNKNDLFEERLAGKPLRLTYPEYTGTTMICQHHVFLLVYLGADDDVDAAKAFIKNKYTSLLPVREHGAERNIYPHFTCSVGTKIPFSKSVFVILIFFLDSGNIRFVFESVKDTVLAINLYYWTPY